MPLFGRRGGRDADDDGARGNGSVPRPDGSPRAELARLGVPVPPLRRLTTTAAGQDVWVADERGSGTVALWRQVRKVHPDTSSSTSRTTTRRPRR